MASIWWRQLRGQDLPYRPTQRRTVGHTHVLPPQQRTPAAARAVMVRMIHKAATRMRRLGYSAGRLDAMVKYMDHPRWRQWSHVVPPSRDTLSLLHVLGDLWPTSPRSKPLHVGVVLSDLVADRSATAPLFESQRHLSDLADVMDQIDTKHGRHTIYFAGMYGAHDSAPTRISFTQIPEMDEF
jgi:DNA polymerase-4